MLEYQNAKIILQMNTLQSFPSLCNLAIKKVKTTVPWTYAISDLHSKRDCRNIL